MRQPAHHTRHLTKQLNQQLGQSQNSMLISPSSNSLPSSSSSSSSTSPSMNRSSTFQITQLLQIPQTNSSNSIIQVALPPEISIPEFIPPEGFFLFSLLTFFFFLSYFQCLFLSELNQKKKKNIRNKSNDQRI